jgi:hypothetical protein
MRIFVAAIICAILFVVSPLRAQDKIETSDTDFFVQTAGGNPAICGLEFWLVYHDHTYGGGALAGVTGSLGWFEDKGNIGMGLKIVGRDFPNADKSDMTAKPFKVVQGSVAVDSKPISPYGSVSCEEPANFCGTYWSPNSILIGTALASMRPLAITFNREANGLDVSLPLDPRERTRTKPDEFRAFSACMSTLAERAKATLSK